MMNLLNPVLSFLFPVFCGNCESIVEDINDGPACESCWAATRLYTGTETICSKCGAFHSDRKHKRETYCRRCSDDHFDMARSCGPYRNALRVIVLELKNTPRIAGRPADILFETYVRESFRNVDVLVPVPLSNRRRFERGFNQAEVLAMSLSKRSKVPVDRRSLIRSKHTAVSRALMDRKGRALTVQNAFEVRRRSLIMNKNVLLLDDVFTSGATVSMAAKALKTNGAAKVYVLTLARATGMN